MLELELELEATEPEEATAYDEGNILAVRNRAIQTEESLIKVLLNIINISLSL